MKYSLGISNFLEEISSLLFSRSPFCCFPLSLCTDHWRSLSYLSFLFFGTLHSKWVYLSFSPLPFMSLLLSAICKVSSDNHFAFFHFFFLGMVLITASYTMSGISIHSSSGTVSVRSNIIRSNLNKNYHLLNPEGTYGSTFIICATQCIEHILWILFRQ